MCREGQIRGGVLKGALDLLNVDNILQGELKGFRDEVFCLREGKYPGGRGAPFGQRTADSSVAA